MIFRDFILYLFSGIFFGFVLVKAEVVSWFRIQEMFRFQDFHMYGIIGLAILTGMICIQVMNKRNSKDINGVPIALKPKDPTQTRRYLIGGTLFGFGWAFTGACPAPLFALLGSGIPVIIVPIISALIGTYVYGIFQHKLPH